MATNHHRPHDYDHDYRSSNFVVVDALEKQRWWAPSCFECYAPHPFEIVDSLRFLLIQIIGRHALNLTCLCFSFRSVCSNLSVFYYLTSTPMDRQVPSTKYLSK